MAVGIMDQWDEDKNKKNIQKHHISFNQAIEIFDRDVLTFVDDRFEYGEVREISIGIAGNTLMTTVVHTDRQGITRIISARPASKLEREKYFKKFPQS